MELYYCIIYRNSQLSNLEIKLLSICIMKLSRNIFND
jgi:hypothetical protein